jgi:hypothetical protein
MLMITQVPGMEPLKLRVPLASTTADQKHLFVGSRAEHFAPVQIQAFVKLPPKRFLGNPVAMLSFGKATQNPGLGVNERCRDFQ